ncbi:hypothetical protein MICAC_180021 [Microcystis aeruginosa PCC 9443]|uniref:Type II toxin-antitoxin system PemK/MazF family toxin n=1 Tax=Microcystis aeruginosa PCC 9443 TaxID=1160281 RepID=I4FZZ7_MICAE|nr:hypothetical protein MICAC_180021 [Microcystis aeruginosa PCC 9443]
MKSGDIVLIRFPQADLQSGKLRPALILLFHQVAIVIYYLL